MCQLILESSTLCWESLWGGTWLESESVCSTLLEPFVVSLIYARYGSCRNCVHKEVSCITSEVDYGLRGVWGLEVVYCTVQKFNIETSLSDDLSIGPYALPSEGKRRGRERRTTREIKSQIPAISIGCERECWLSVTLVHVISLGAVHRVT